MKNYTAWLKKHSSFKNILVFFVFAIIINLLLGKFFGALEHGIPDTSLHYTANEFYALMAKYAQDELGVYIRGMVLLDFLYPIVYSFFFTFLIYRLSHQAVLSVLPFFVLIFDYLENLSVLTLIWLLPARNDVLATFAGYFTLVKWLLAALCLLLVLVLGIRYLIRVKFYRNE